MEHIIDPATAVFEHQWHFSHIVRSRGLLFLSGVTGTGTDGQVAEDPTEQFEQLFTHLRQYLNAAGASLADLVEITTYHVDLRAHLQAFTAVKDAYLPSPYPAWSAIGVSQLITPRRAGRAPRDRRRPHSVNTPPQQAMPGWPASPKRRAISRSPAPAPINPVAASHPSSPRAAQPRRAILHTPADRTTTQPSPQAVTPAIKDR